MNLSWTKNLIKEILEKLNSNTTVVGIDEIQFFEVDILPIIEELKKVNK